MVLLTNPNGDGTLFDIIMMLLVCYVSAWCLATVYVWDRTVIEQEAPWEHSLVRCITVKPIALCHYTPASTKLKEGGGGGGGGGGGYTGFTLSVSLSFCPSVHPSVD